MAMLAFVCKAQPYPAVATVKMDITIGSKRRRALSIGKTSLLSVPTDRLNA